LLAISTIFPCVTFPKIIDGYFRNTVTLPCGLTVDGADNSVFVRVFAMIARSRSYTHWTTKKFSTE